MEPSPRHAKLTDVEVLRARLRNWEARPTERAFALGFVGGSQCAAAQVAGLWGSWNVDPGGHGRFAATRVATRGQSRPDDTARWRSGKPAFVQNTIYLLILSERVARPSVP